MFKSAWCLWRLGRSDEAAKRFVAVFEITRRSGQEGQRRPADSSSTSCRARRCKYLVEVFTEDEKNTAQDVYGFLTKIGGDPFAGKVVRALAVQFYDQAHWRARHRGVRAFPQARARLAAMPANGCSQIAQGYAVGGGLAEARSRPTNALVAGCTARLGVGEDEVISRGARISPPTSRSSSASIAPTHAKVANGAMN